MRMDFVPSSDRNNEEYRGKRSLFLLSGPRMSQTVINAVKKKKQNQKGHIEINTTYISLLGKTRSYDLG